MTCPLEGGDDRLDSDLFLLLLTTIITPPSPMTSIVLMSGIINEKVTGTPVRAKCDYANRERGDVGVNMTATRVALHLV